MHPRCRPPGSRRAFGPGRPLPRRSSSVCPLRCRSLRSPCTGRQHRLDCKTARRRTTRRRLPRCILVRNRMQCRPPHWLTCRCRPGSQPDRPGYRRGKHSRECTPPLPCTAECRCHRISTRRPPGRQQNKEPGQRIPPCAGSCAPLREGAHTPLGDNGGQVISKALLI